MSEDASPKSRAAVAAIISDLLDGGELVDAGSFSLDVEAASERMEAFAYADRDVYLVPLVEGILRLEAKGIAFEMMGEDLLVRAHLVQLSTPMEALTRLHQCSLGAGSDSDETFALRRIAVGIDMALGHASIERIVVAYESDGGRIVAELRPGEVPVVKRGDSAAKQGELRIVVDRPLRKRLSLQGAARRELAHLREAVRRCRTSITLDGREISGQWPELSYRQSRATPGAWRFESGLERGSELPSRIELYSGGIRVDVRDDDGIAHLAMLHLTRPRYDLSQTKVVVDDDLTDAVAQVAEAKRIMLMQLAEDDERWGTTDARPEHWPKARVDLVLGRREHTGTSAFTGAKRTWQLRDLAFALPFYLGGIAAGTVGIALTMRGMPGALFACVFLILLGGAGARMLSQVVFGGEGPAPKGLSVALFVVAVALALGLGALFGTVGL